MSKPAKRNLLLEQLEDRIFLDANPVAGALDGPGIDVPDLPDPVASTDPAAHDLPDIAHQPGTEQVAQEEQDPAAAPPAAADSDAVAPAQETGTDANTMAASQQQENGTTETAGDETAGQDPGEAGTGTGPQVPGDGTMDTGQADDLQNSAEPTVSDSMDTAGTDQAIDPMIGEDFEFTVSFDNTTASTVYGPYIDILLDGGQDGADATVDGITFQGATYLGVDVEARVIDITSDGQVVDHPWATDSNGDPLQVDGINGHTFRAGDQFVSLRMPFGSFETDQPAAEVSVTAHMSENADVGPGNDLAVEVTTGAMYGHDALDNPAADPPLRDIATSSLSFSPEVITYNADIEITGVQGDCQVQHAADHDTRYQADDPGQVFESNHQEIPTGPNYPGTYVARIGIADGQSVDNLVLTEHLPDNIVFLGNVSVTDSGGTPLTFHTNQIGTDLQISLDAPVTGTGNATDVTIRYDFYVPEQTGSGQAIIDPLTGDAVHIVNNGEVSYTWTPVDSHDPGPVNGVVNAEVDQDGHFSDAPDIDDISHAQSIAIQKDHALSTDAGAAGYSPGDTVDFTLDFQVSDFFSFGDHDPADGDYSFRIDDLVPDGLTMNNNGSSYLAGIDIWQGTTLVHLDLASTTTPGDMMWVTTDADNNLEVHYNLHEILTSMGFSDGILHGDMTDGSQDGPTHGRITYSADIARVYHDENNSGGSGGTDNDIDQGDILAGPASITGEIYANNGFTGQAEGDGSCDSLQIVTGSVDKNIYAVNGITGVGVNPHISPGDTVTYRLYYDMPLSSTEDFHLVDYLPLPIFDVNDPDQDGTASGWSQVADGTLPGAGEWAFTANDTYHNLNTTMDSVGPGTGNSLVFDWAPYHDASGTSSTVEILFTVTVSGEPFADGMYLTNQVRATEQGTPLADNTTDAITQVVLDQPELTITKGAVETDNPAGAFLGNAGVDSYFTDPGSSGFRSEGGTVISSDWLAGHNIDTNLIGIDAGDLVTFAIVVQNTGHSGAFDIRITDDMPTGFTTPSGGLNLSVTDGAGNALAYSGDLFTGLEITDDADGALAPTDPASGADILVITYDLAATTGVSSFQNLDNTARITNYAGTEGGTDHTVTDPTDNARVTTAAARTDKVLVSTNQAHTGGTDVAIGEQAQYTVTFTVPEGTLYNARLTDAMTDNAAGVEMAVLSLDSISASAGLSAANGTFDDILNNATIDADGGGFTLDFGDLVNSDTDNSATETVTVTFTGVVLNNPDLDRGETVNDQARLIWQDGNGVFHSHADSGPDLTVVEPTLQVTKTVDAPHPDQDDTITFTMVIEHAGSSDADAFEASLADTIPTGLTYVTGSLQHTGGLAPDSLAISGNVISASWSTFAQGQSSTITFQAHLDTAQAGQDLSNTADIGWTGLPGDVTAPQSTHNSLSTERTGDTADPGGAANDYRDASTAQVTVIATIDKQDPSPTAYTIGEEVTYAIQVDLPEGDTNGLVVTDALPDGMVYVSHQVDTSSFSGTLNAPTVVSTAGDGNDITFDFGNVQVTADNDSTNNGFTIQVTVQVLDQGSNYQGVTLTNHASMTFDDPNNPGQRITTDDPTDPTVTVVEPQITTLKTVTDSADAGTDASPGEVMTYTVRFTNTGQSTAYEVNARDTLPGGVAFNAGSASAADQDGAAVPVTVTDNGAGTLTIGGDWDIAVGDWVQVQYTVTVMGAGFTAGTYSNTVDGDWSSMDGSQAGERTYADTGNSPVDGSQDQDSASFTVVTDGSIGDMVFFDANDSGGFSADDVGISGVNVTISADVDNDGTPEYTRTVTTDSSGNYLFDNLAAFDAYTISVDYDASGGSPFNLQDSGYHQTYDLDEDGSPVLDHTAREISLAAGQDRTDVDFGYTGQNSVGDVVWWDGDGDGTQDANEGGLNGLRVTLYADIDGDGDYEYSTSTSTASHTVGGVTTDGWYSFGDSLPAGDYRVVVAPPSGSVQTYDIDGSTTGASANTGNFTLTADNDRDDIDFGYRGTGSLGDFVWFDADADGNQDDGADSGLANVTVQLSADFDHDGTADYTTSTVTANDGSYTFANLLGAAYTVSVDTATLPSGSSNWTQTHDLDGTGTPDTASLNLAAGGTDNTVDFGYTGTGSLGDRVWLDLDADGVQDTDELGLANVTVHITADVDGDGVNEWTGTAQTDANGNYTFDHLPAADYTTTIDTNTLPGGFEQTYDKDDNLAPFTSPNSDTTTLGIGANETDVDFGYRGTGSIGDFIWYDADGDGTQNEGPASGLGGIDVTLTGDFDNDGVNETRTTTTADDGSYHFDHLLAGNYTVSVDHSDLPGGMVATHDLDGIGTADVAAVALAAGQTRADVDFGYRGIGSIGDTVFFDADNSGSETAGDVGISGVDVTLTADIDNDGVSEYTQTVRTDANGRYTFGNLAAFDSYVITVDTATSGGTNPTNLAGEGYTQTFDQDGTASANTTTASLAAGQDRTDIDFGYTGQNSVGDTVWFDVDGDGNQDDGTTGTPAEDGIGGLTVTLSADIDGDGNYEYTTSTTTDADGHYRFDHLPAGDYAVSVTPPAGSTPTYDHDGGTSSPDNTTPLTLGADQDRDDIDFGIRGTGSIGDYVWYDGNADTNQANDGTDAGIGGVEITLTGDIDGDGTVDYTATTTTADDGSYSFAHLLGGSYTITVDAATLPGGSSNWTQTYDEDGTGSANTVVHSLAAGSNDDTVDFGYTGNGSLGDTVWYDINGNGVQEGTEPGLAGVTVTISADVDGDGFNEFSTSTQTDANGLYQFDHLVGTDYTISVDTGTLPDGATPTYDLDSATTSPDSTTLYTLATGEHTDRVDFGYTGTGAIGDTVWNDINGDGIQDPGENGFAGVTVTLTGDLDHDGQADDTLTTTTDASGHYAFANLFLGDYTVAVDPATLPPGNSQTHDYDDPHSTTPATPNTAAVTLDAADPVNNDVDFGYNSQATIGDTIWYDADNDGIQDPGELGLSGVTVTLTGDVDGDGNPDTVVATTDADGHYLFDQLQAGDYTITVSNLPPGMAQTADPDGVNDNTTTLGLAGGATNLDQDFGYTGTGSIGDTIWNDADGDTTQNSGETGLAGVTVTLTADLNNDGVMDTVTTTTDANGNYHFDNLPADNYTITVDPATLPPGMNQTFDPDGGNDNTADVTLAAGETNNDQDFGYQQTGAIGDTIWYDADGDGVQDPGELGLNGVTVTLTDGNGNTVATATTSSDGTYLFDNLNAGDYTITLTGLPNGMTQTADPDGGNDNSSQVTIGGSSPLVNLDQDFGYTGTGSIGDTIWNDADGDTTQNSGETGLAGVTVTLTADLNNDGVMDTVTTTTDANGNYHFDNLPADNYTITVDPATLPPGMNQTFDPDGGNDNTADVTLAAGETNNDQDFGYQQTGAIGDTIWYDADGDGVQDPGEPGLANVQVTLVGDLDGDGVADDTLTTVTDGDGNYLFDRLPAGSYAITVDPSTLPGGMEETFDADGTGSPDTAQVTIGNNEANLDVDFGYTGTGSIGDTIWYDADNDGVQDPDEVGIPGVTVTLTGDFDNDGQTDDTMTVTTGPDGTYLFPNLPAGEFDITVDPATLPGGMTGSGDPDGVIDNTTTLTLAPGQDDLSRDFGYTGTGSIGDQLWVDSNGNGVQDPGEGGLAGVQVCIGVDLDGDGQPDYRAITTTDASGAYLFDNLPAGSHTVCVNPATLPPGIQPGFDPDGGGDNTTLVDLGAGEQNRSTDFGYTFPPSPPVTPVPPEPRPVTPSPAVPAAEPVLPEADSLLMYRQFAEQTEETLFTPFAGIPWPQPLVPISPVYSGHAEPGTTLFMTLFDVHGDAIGYQTVMADTAGNWLAGFPGSLLYDVPHHLEIEQTISSYNDSSAGMFNLRTYFNPDFSSMVFSTVPLTADAVFAEMPTTVMESVHQSNLSSFTLRWNGYRDYEFLSPSINPSNLSH